MADIAKADISFHERDDPPDHHREKKVIQKPADVEAVLERSPEDILEANDAVKKVVRRIDLRLLPILSITYSFSLTDRVNLPNARIVGMGDDLGL
ncbi:hypothetical protein LTR93_011821 [Exophiala xenobiotica]|nr:hypothetical protein LTR93_011821 [Exophiala xenobiotica]